MNQPEPQVEIMYLVRDKPQAAIAIQTRTSVTSMTGLTIAVVPTAAKRKPT